MREREYGDKCEKHDLRRICPVCARELLRETVPRINRRRLKVRQLPAELMDFEAEQDKLKEELRKLARRIRKLIKAKRSVSGLGTGVLR